MTVAYSEVDAYDETWGPQAATEYINALNNPKNYVANNSETPYTAY